MDVSTSLSVPPELRTTPTAVQSPIRYAAALALAYAAFGTLYIVFSTKIVAAMSISVEQMKHFETYKGIGFIVITSVLLFLFTLLQFRRIRHQEERIARQLHALENSERAMFAGTFAGAIAHDINNALSASMLAAETLREDLANDPERAALADDVREALKAIQEWNRRLFEVGGRAKIAAKAPIDIADIARTSADLARRHLSLRGRSLTLRGADGRVAYTGSEQFIRRALLNLILNAAEATAQNGKIEVTIDASAPQKIVIRVDDNGAGVPEDLRKKILEPFYTTKPDGTGMGLASVVACAEMHGGRVTIGDSPLGGARFEVTLRNT